MLRSPKERFLASTYSGQWGKICQGDVFEEAMHAAINQLAMDMPMPMDGPLVPQLSCDSYQQMVGARKFMEILSSLYTSQTTPKQVQRVELNYKAGV